MSTSPASLTDPKQVLDRAEKPPGVISKRAQQYVYVGIAVVIVVISMFSSNRQPKAPARNDAAKAPVLEETNPRKLTDYAAELTAEQKAAERARLAEASTLNGKGGHMNDPRFGPAGASSNRESQSLTDQSAYPAQNNQPDPLKQRERERAYNARFASNFAFPSPVAKGTPAVATDSLDLPSDTRPDPQPGAQGQLSGQGSAPNKKSSVSVNDATGPPYVLFEGTLIETALVNRLDGDFSGPVKVMVTNSVFSHDRQHVLIPEGTFVLGEVKPVQGFGQRRLAVVFHRLRMPDGYAVDLDQFRGLDQIGATGLKDQVNNHYLQIFGASIALGIISGAAESSVNNVGIGASGSEAYRAGTASSLFQSSTRVLDRFLNINPTLTIREGHRVKVYLTNDLLLPAYENHRVPPNI
jgi:type IV secretory pathway VirB10-like protein